MSSLSEQGPSTVVRRLLDATNDHDVDAIVACFAPDYRNETPVHPARSFVGSEQVRHNWAQIFTAVSDLKAEVVAAAVDGDTVWTEWEHQGVRPDGSAHLMRGVVIFTVAEGLIESARFFLEPVQRADGDVAEAVRRQVDPTARS